jgi:hypothetical protein
MRRLVAEGANGNVVTAYVDLTIHIEALRGPVGHALALVTNVSPLGQSRARGASDLDLGSGKHFSLVALPRVWQLSVLLLRCGSKFADGTMGVGPASRQRSQESLKHRCSSLSPSQRDGNG